MRGRILWCFAVLAALESALWAGNYPNYSLEDGDQDLRIHTGMHGVLRGRQAAFGDFDGDGLPDAAFMLVLTGPFTYSDVSFLRGIQARWQGEINLLEKRSSVYYERANNHQVLETLADTNGDRMDDLVLLKFGLSIFRGATQWSPYLDTEINNANVFMPWNPSPASVVLAAGDINGDEIQDLVAVESAATPVLDGAYVILGRSSWLSPINLDTSPEILRWHGYANALMGVRPVFRWNGDSFDDVAFTRANGIDVLFGSANLPASWDASVDTPPLRITASPGWTLEFGASADVTGDGRADMVVREASGAAVRWRLLDGAAVGALLGMQALDSLTPRLLRAADAADHLEAAGDFDGDGRADLVWTSTATGSGRTLVFLAADQPSGSDWNGAPSFRIEGEAGEEDELHLVDMDRDGKNDLWIIQKPTSASAFRWHINLFYGFRPLKNPTIRLLDRDESSKRAGLELTVDGNPAEMKLSGDIEDDIKDRWIPYERHHRISLTGSPGAKTITATFRLAEGRESAPASVSLGVSADGPRVRSVTNRLKGESVAELDCRVTTHVKASVYERGGRKVTTVADQDASGIVTVRWDGRNDAGERMRPGVYVMVLEIDGRTERKEILVER